MARVLKMGRSGVARVDGHGRRGVQCPLVLIGEPLPRPSLVGARGRRAIDTAQGRPLGLRTIGSAVFLRHIFQSAASAIGTIAAPIPTSTMIFRYWRINGI